jgi:glycolate oxidase iron-sulfur subunit
LALARANIQKFSAIDVEAIVFLSSGCGAHLRDYAVLPWSSTTEQQQAQQFSSKVMEACAWVNAHIDLPMDNPGIKSIAVHTPCSHRNVVGNSEIVTQLLRRIPGLRVHELEKTGCCGGAGDYPLREPELAVQVREPVLHGVLATKINYLATTNLGCALSLGAGLRDSDPRICVAHPLTVFAMALSTQAK